MNPEGRKPKIFYGWYVLAIGMFGAFMGAGLSQVFMSVMLKPLTEEFGWSRTSATGVITTGTIVGGLFSLPFGRLADRYGTRLLTSVGGVVTAAAYIAMTRFAHLWEFYAVYVIARVFATNALSIIAPQTAIVNWFRRFRGRALGLLSMSTPLGAAVLAFTAQIIMEHHGWRSVFILFSLITFFLQAVPAALVLRRRPEDMGLLPDGSRTAPSEPSPGYKGLAGGEVTWTLRSVVRTPTLWLIISAAVLSLTVNSGIGFHLVAYYTDVGIVPSIAVAALSVYALTGALANVIWGLLSERVSERLLASAVMILAGGSILFLKYVNTPTEAFIFAVMFGLTSRGETTLVNMILAQYYGRRSYGTVSGFVHPFNMLGLGIGPLVCSLSFDFTGSYQLFFNVFIGLSFLAALLLWLARKPALPAGSMMTA